MSLLTVHNFREKHAVLGVVTVETKSICLRTIVIYIYVYAYYNKILENITRVISITRVPEVRVSPSDK